MVDLSNLYQERKTEREILISPD